MFFFPGIALLLVSRGLRGASLLAIFSLGFLLSILFLGVLLLCGMLFEVKQQLVTTFILLIMFIAAAATVYALRTGRTEQWRLYFRRFRWKLRPEDYAFLAITLAVTFVMLYRGGILEFGDGWLHIAYITKFYQSASLNPVYPFFPEVQPDTNYGYCPLHPLYALLAVYTGRSVLWLWYYLPFLLTPVILGVNYYFARLLTQSRFVALLSILMLIYFMGFLGMPMLGFAIGAYPRTIAVSIIVPLLWLLAIQNIRVFKRWNAILFLLGFATLLIFHKLTAIHFLMYYVVFLIVVIISRRCCSSVWYKRLALLLGYMLISCIIYYIVVPIEKVRNPVHLEFRSEEISPIEGTPFSIAKPDIFLFQGGPITSHAPITPLPLFAYLLIPGLFLSPRRNSLGKIYLLAGALLVPATLFNPLIFPLLSKILTIEGTIRLVQMAPYHLIFPYSMYLIIQNTLTDMYTILRRRSNRYFIAGFIALATMVIVIPYGFAKSPNKGRFLKSDRDLIRMNPLYEVSSYITSTFMPANECLVTDFYTSYIVGALTGIEVLGIPETMSAPNHTIIQSKNLYLYRFFSGITAEQRLKIARVTGATMVLLNRRELGDALYGALKKEFETHPQWYMRLYLADGLELYQFRHEASAGKK